MPTGLQNDPQMELKRSQEGCKRDPETQLSKKREISILFSKYHGSRHVSYLRNRPFWEPLATKSEPKCSKKSTSENELKKHEKVTKLA